MSKLFTDGKANQAYWNRYQAIVNGIKEAGFRHPHMADTHAMVQSESRSVEEWVKEWGKDRFNRK